MSKIISIIIPVYNVELFVEKCIRSCAEQFKQDSEIIVVNDGSPDKSLDIVNQLTTVYDNITIITQPNLGLSAARNTGLRAASGKYVWFIDSDDWIDNRARGILLDYLDKDFDIITFVAAEVYDNTIRPICSKKSIENVPCTGLDLYEDDSWYPPVWQNLYRREFLVHNNLYMYEGILHEDTEFEPRAYFLADRAIAINKTLYYVRQNPTSITRTFNPRRAFDLLKVAESLSDFYQVHTCKRLLPLISVRISSCLNSVIRNFIYLSKEDKQNLLLNLNNSSHLFNYYRTSKMQKHNIQYVLYLISFKSPNRYIKLCTFKQNGYGNNQE